VAIPKLRAGSYFPDLLRGTSAPQRAGADQRGGDILPRGRVHAAGGKLAATLGITSLSKSQVSQPAKSLDAQVEQFRSRPLDGGAVPIRSCGCDDGAGPRGRPHRTGARIHCVLQPSCHVRYRQRSESRMTAMEFPWSSPVIGGRALYLARTEWEWLLRAVARWRRWPR